MYNRHMSDMRVRLPRFVNEGYSDALMNRLKNASDESEDVILDAEQVVWLSPFGTVLLADFAYKRLINGKRVQLVNLKHQDTREYIDQSGLLNITRSRTIGGAISRDNLQLRLLNQMEPMVPEMLVDFITQQADRADDVGDDEKFLLRTWITELLTNANDHAQSESGFWVCGRYNPIRQEIRICVADSGIGIKQSLVTSGRLPSYISDEQAIRRALEEGMTSRQGRTGGLGLKLITAYIKAHGGSITIWSGDGKVYIERKKIRSKHNHENYSGTIVNVRFDIKTISSSSLETETFGPFHFGG
jgi:anti-sigma regulatory factor (Ser/Thr protein kinase)